VSGSRVGAGPIIAAAGGVGLVVTMFLPWFSATLSVPGIGSAEDSFSAWQSFQVIDIVLFLTAVLAVAFAAVRAAGAETENAAIPMDVAVLVAGLVCCALIVFRLIDPPVEQARFVEPARDYGGFIGLAAAIVVAIGGLLALGERRGAPGRPVSPTGGDAAP
jgi:hypothetical protein